MGRHIIWAISGLALASQGCASMNHTERDAAIGGVVGTGAGGLVGAATGNPKTGLIAGGILGTIAGAAIGSEKDEREARESRVAAEQAYQDAQPTRIAEIVELTRNGHSEQVIINHIRDHRMTFQLSVADLNTLKANHVGDRVITEMQNSRVVARRPRTVYVREPVYVDHCWGPPPPVIVAPPPVVGVGFHYRH